jgi:hypothetical protein
MTANVLAIETGRSDTKTKGHSPRPPIDFSTPHRRTDAVRRVTIPRRYKLAISQAELKA